MPDHDAPVSLSDSLGRATVVARWVLMRGVRQPLIGILSLLLLGLVPLLARLSPLADIGLDPAWALADAWIVPLGLLGMALSLAALGQARAFLELLPWASRWLGEALALLIGALGLQIPLVLGAAWNAHGGPGLAPIFWLSADLHAAGVGLLLLRWKTRRWMRVAGFGALLWLLPAMLPTSRLATGLAVLADLEQPSTSAATPAAWVSRAAVVVGLALASALLAASRNGVSQAQTTIQDEVRNPG